MLYTIDDTQAAHASSKICDGQIITVAVYHNTNQQPCNPSNAWLYIAYLYLASSYKDRSLFKKHIIIRMFSKN